MGSRIRRRRMIVGSVQRRLLLAYAIHTIMVIGLFVAALYVPSLLMVNDADLAHGDRAKVASEMLAQVQQLWPALIAVLLVAGVHAVIISHRVAGPMVQIHRAAERLRAGDLNHRISIRKNDYLKAEVAAINSMLDAYASHAHARGEWATEAASDHVTV